MDGQRLSNAFVALELDGEDDRLDAPPQFSSSSGCSSVAENGHASSGTRRRSCNGSALVAAAKNRKEVGVSETMTLAVYKLPLVWFDLEMTGLNVEVDRILEIVCIITDGSLRKSIEGPNLVIHQSQECLDGMGEWCLSHHAASVKCGKLYSSFSWKFCLYGFPVFKDNRNTCQIWRASSNVLVDVSSVKALCIRWYPKDQKKAPTKENKHKATDDIRESITELEFYKENTFKLSKYRRLCLKLLAIRPKLWLTRQSFLTGPDESLEMIGIVGFTTG